MTSLVSGGHKHKFEIIVVAVFDYDTLISIWRKPQEFNVQAVIFLSQIA